MPKADRVVTQCMKYEMKYAGDKEQYNLVRDSMFEFSKHTRAILNETTRIWWEWEGKTIQERKDVGCGLDTYAYRVLAPKYSEMMGTAILNANIRNAIKRCKNLAAEIKTGKVSVPSYRADQPFRVPSKQMKLEKQDHGYTVRLSLFPQEWGKAHGFTMVLFNLMVKDGTQRKIIDSLLNEEYSLSESQVGFKNGKWFLTLAYSHKPETHALDKDKIVGVDVGQVLALVASIKDDRDALKIPGTEALAAFRRIERMKWDLSKQARYPGDSRIGHGTKKRVEPVYRQRTTIANMQDTLNHRWSRAVVDFAVKKGAGVIQMEDLSGVKDSELGHTVLKHWTYFDLQSKIEYKAKEKGIEVWKVKPRYTSQRCSSCGWINKENRPDQSHFECVSCGYKANADYNASQNLAIKDIDILIKAQLEAENK